MKICFITNSFSNSLIGGSNVYVKRLVDELLKRGNEIIVITIDPKKKSSVTIENNVKFYKFHPFSIATSQTIGSSNLVTQAIWTLLDIYSPYGFIKIKQFLKKENPDIVHVHTPIDLTLSVFDAIKSLRLPVVFTAHDYLLLCRRLTLLHANNRICDKTNINFLCKIYRSLVRQYIKGKPDFVIFPSEFIKNKFKENDFFLNTKTLVLPYGIDLDNSDKQVKSKTQNRPFNILYVGSLTRHKGIENLIAAFKKISNDHLSLSIIGEGIHELKLKKIAQADKRIRFLGKINNNDLADYYCNANVLVVPSIWYEVLGIVIQEAFKYGVPVIGSRIGGIPEIIQDGFNGFLFERGDVLKLKELLEKFICKPNLLEQMSKNAKKSVFKYSMNQHINRILTIYSELI